MKKVSDLCFRIARLFHAVLLDWRSVRRRTLNVDAASLGDVYKAYPLPLTHLRVKLETIDLWADIFKSAYG